MARTGHGEVRLEVLGADQSRKSSHGQSRFSTVVVPYFPDDAFHQTWTMSSLSVANLFGVQGRIALVTGGCSGIGFMIAKVSEALERHQLVY